MERIILKNGTVFEGGSAGLSDGFLWLWLPISITEAIRFVFDPEIMNRIIYQYSEDMEDVFAGFTVCRSLMQDGEQLSVCMVKG